MTSYRMTDCHKTQPPGLPCFLGDTLQAQCMLIFIYHIPEKTATFCLFIVMVVFSVFVLGSMSRRERTHISEEAKVFLQKAYKEGMTRVGSPLVGTASQATGLPPFVIDNWIGNYRRKKPSSSQPKNKKLYTKDLSGYNLFCRDQLKNKGSLKDITQKWSTLAEEQKRQYAEEAAALKVQRTSDGMSPEMRCLKLKKHLKQLKIEVAGLEKLGVETGVMMYDHQKPLLEVLEVSSKGASSFFNSTDVLDNFALHFQGKSLSTSAAKEPVDQIVKKVQDLFNRKY
ncbi:hypothetical protein CCH79_00012977, partial [Gambusia affinis]